MNELFESHCNKCNKCQKGTYCNEYKMNPALSLEECLEHDFDKFEPNEE